VQGFLTIDTNFLHSYMKWMGYSLNRLEWNHQVKSGSEIIKHDLNFMT